METPFITPRIEPQIDFRPRPEVFFDIHHLFRCRVRILIVTDASGGYDAATGFHLGQVLQVLADDPWSHVSFKFTKAHRQSGAGGGADMIDNFRFDDHNLGQYDQIWLFGIYSQFGQDPLSDAELRAISEFMDGGGGVFATGDHEDLGNAMCAKVPRVRSMRRWYHPNPGPNGEPVAPDQTGIGRHDTQVDPPGPPGKDQSDKHPQKIRPRYYSRTIFSGWISLIARFPHPVLCGPDGVIEYLPDHMHEGLCEVPSNLGNSFTFSGYTVTEYPTVSGHQERPQVIAWADSHDTDATSFGVLGAYDGHRVGVGRVVVDATWHHWFNINLVGFLAATDPMSAQYDPAIVPKWEAIKAYFRNVGVWLARPSKQHCLRNGGWLIVSRSFDILMTYKPLDRVRQPLPYFWQLGIFARDALGRFASQCQHLQWRLRPIEWLEVPFNPWDDRPQPDPPPFLDLEQLELVALGGVVHAVLERYGERFAEGFDDDLDEFLEKENDALDEVARRGAAQAVSVLFEEMRKGAEQIDRLSKLASEFGR